MPNVTIDFNVAKIASSRASVSLSYVTIAFNVTIDFNVAKITSSRASVSLSYVTIAFNVARPFCLMDVAEF